jgi:salicylate 5-hydroxylase small subunit
VIGPLRLLSQAEGAWETEAAYAVFRTRTDELTEVFNVGRTLDRVVRHEGC